nr:small heat shock protein [Phoronis australis]
MSYRRVFQDLFRRSLCSARQYQLRRGFRDTQCLQNEGGHGRGRWLYPRWGPGGSWFSGNRAFPFGFMREAAKVMEEMQRDLDRAFPARHGYGPGWWGPRHGVISAESALPEIKFTDGEFRVRVDVQHYTPEEIGVKIADNTIKISGKHETKHDDYGMVAREFTREFSIPEEIDQESLECQISEDGFLTVMGSVKRSEQPKPRTLKIEREKGSEIKNDE